MLVAASSSLLFCQSNDNSVTQLVTIVVKPVAKLVVSGNPNAMIISDAVAGSPVTSVEDASTKYSFITNLDNMKIVASISDKMPTGTTLRIKLSSSKAASSGTVDLSSATTPVDVVTGISRCSDVNQTIDYTFAANADVGTIPTQSRVVTLTLTN